ncbi:class I SAM-dependent methyltransferase [Paraburkholderia tropica]|uniref:class I SAM-dependent methyltransferase n=1 Tax=Paraburkholderia tropica TaxID=92647 RepID=UPI002AB6C34B|nr:class I SAM-dependent methyltransferase [Paraburkholderia tropica]
MSRTDLADLALVHSSERRAQTPYWSTFFNTCDSDCPRSHLIDPNNANTVDTNNLIQVIEYSIFRKTTDSFDVLQCAKIDAALSSARYYQRNMLRSKNFSNDLDHLAFSLENTCINGLYLEFGVASGRTINHIAGLKSGQTIYGFDVFTGLPETWRTGFESGAFGRAALPPVRENCKLISGLFENTLPPFIEGKSRDIAFIHVDCDLYAGTRTILETCRPYLKAGTVICFDEYFNYPGYEQHEFLAWREFYNKYGIAYEYLGFVSSHQQVSIRITAIA